MMAGFEDNEYDFGNEDNLEMHEDTGIEDVVDSVGLPWEDGVDLLKGQEFGSKDEVKVLVQIASHRTCFEYKVDKSDRTRYVLKCAAHQEGCKWYLRVVPIKDSDRWKVVSYEKMHTCLRAVASTMIKRRRGTATIVASMLEEEYPGNFATPKPKVLMKMVKAKMGVDLAYSTAWKGKQLAANLIRGSPEESYQMLDSYLYMLRMTNPGTQTFVERDDAGRFKYMFFALGACIEGFEHMRKVIIVDATHLKHSYGGVLIVAMAQDPNHHHYPIAFGVADCENEGTWMWFMKKLELIVSDRRGMMFISDRNQALIKSVRLVFPLSEHGYCIYHLSQNVKGSVSGTRKQTVAGDFMKCAQAYTEHEFLTLYSAFKRRYPAADVYLNKSVDVRKWARCYFPGERYNIVTTNSVESVNAAFVDARKYTLLPMIDMIVAKVCEWFNVQRKASRAVPKSQRLVPRVNDIVETNLPIGKKLPSVQLNSITHEYLVSGLDGKDYVVNLSHLTCTCKYFDIDRYPCVHAVQAIIQLSGESGVHHYEFASPFYQVKKWVKAYKRTIYPVPHMTTWVIPEEEQQNFCFGYPPAHKITKGPSQQTRFKSPGEHRGRGRPREIHRVESEL